MQNIDPSSPDLCKLTSEQLSDALLRCPVFMVIATDNKGLVTFFNAAAEQALGYSAAEIVGKKTPEIWHDPQEIRQYAARLSAELGASVEPGFEVFVKKSRLFDMEDKEWTFIRKDGSRFPVHLGVDCIKDAQGRTVGFLGLAKDITTRVMQKQTLINREIFLDTVVHHILDGLMTMDDKGIVQSYNPACEALFNYKAEEVIGKNISMLMPEPDHSKHDDYLKHYLTTGEKRIIGMPREVQGRRKDGSVFPLELSVSRFEIDGNIMFCGTLHDVSERNESQKELEQLVAKLTESNAELERFAYVASHDMQEPLRAMSSFSDLLLSEYQNCLGDEGKLYLNLIRDAAVRMQTLVIDMLEYARIGQESARYESFNANEEFSHLLQNLSTSIEKNKATVTSDTLPPMKGNPVQFLRLLQNLVDNGIKFHRRDVPPVIHIQVEDKGTHWLFSVSDNGIGINAQHLSRIFEPFKRLHNQQKYQGTGLGLTLCKKIVENHSGTIWCCSAEGIGSQFSFTWLK